MPTEAVQFAQAVEKLGIIGVLVLVTFLLGYAAFYFRREVIAAHAQREKELGQARATIESLKLMFVIVRQAADAAGVKYDLGDVRDLDGLIGRGGQA